MSKWTFFGKVHPERIPVTWDVPISARARQPDFGITFDYRAVIHASQVIVDIEVITGAPDIDSLRHVAQNCARMITDLVGYGAGCFLDVEIISVISRDNDEWRIFGTEIPVLVARENSHRHSAFSGELVKAVVGNPYATLALRDFQKAMGDGIGTGFYCYRAVEAMMQSMKTAEIDKDKQAWERLNQVLCLNRSASETIKRHADFPRHGKPSSMTDDERATVFELTDEIIRRFIEYLRRGKEPLSAEEFPILT
jgi:hypothetical protein